jgi:hemoglobin
MMRSASPWRSPLLAACLAALVLAGPALAQPDKGTAPLDRKSLDSIVYNNLKVVLNRGADLYNTGDWAGCYRLYEGSLITLKPLLQHHPALQKSADEALTTAEQDPQVARRAWLLRGALEKIREETNPNPKSKTGPEIKPGPGTEPPVVKKTLWDRLGGEKGVSRIIDDVVASAAKDPKVDFTRGGRYKLDSAEMAKMKRELIDQVSQLTGGPYKYTGPNMKEVHKGMGITRSQFDAFMGHVRNALVKNGVDAKDQKTILDALDGYGNEIIQTKKPEDKKPVDKKPEDKKPIDKRPEDKKPEDKKPVDKKPAETGNVSGKVTYLGKPLTGGQVGMHSAAGKTYSAAIKEDGSFSLKSVPVGTYKVTVMTQPAAPGAPRLPPAPPGGAAKGVAIPVKYSTANTSGLTYEVSEGEQTFDIDLR